MNARERIMAVLRRKEPDIIPFTIYVETKYLAGLALHQPWRKLLDKGLGLHAALAVQTHKVNCPNTMMEINHHYGNLTSWSPVDIMIAFNGPHDITGSLNTPVGKISIKARMESLDLSANLPWFPEDGYFLKSLDDYEVLKFIIEDTEYIPFYDDCESNAVDWSCSKA